MRADSPRRPTVASTPGRYQEVGGRVAKQDRLVAPERGPPIKAPRLFRFQGFPPVITMKRLRTRDSSNQSFCRRRRARVGPRTGPQHNHLQYIYVLSHCTTRMSDSK